MQPCISLVRPTGDDGEGQFQVLSLSLSLADDSIIIIIITIMSVVQYQKANGGFAPRMVSEVREI